MASPRRRLVRFSTCTFAPAAVVVVAFTGSMAAPADAEPQFGATSCSTGQQDTVTRAYVHGRDLAAAAVGFMAHVVDDDDPSGASADAGTDSTRRRASFERWFGSFDASRAAGVHENFAAIHGALLNQDFFMNCQVNAENCPGGTIAWVIAGDMRPTINFCEPFWTRPETGFGSQGGAILHEVSHFMSIAGTGDVLAVVTTRECEQLARDKPARAIENAYNHQYFAEDVFNFGCGGCAVGSRRQPDSGAIAAGIGSVIGLVMLLRAGSTGRRPGGPRPRRPT